MESQLSNLCIYLVSCVSQKKTTPSMARDLYTSNWFVKARCYAESSRHPWYIISAEHGLISPNRIIAPYERTLNTMKISHRRSWAKRVAGQIFEEAPDLTHVVFLAGERYREFLARHLSDKGIKVSIPMKGLRIGEQLSWLTKQAPLPSEQQ